MSSSDRYEEGASAPGRALARGGGTGARGWPLWRRSPILLLHYPELALAIAASALVLAVSVASSPLFLSSAETAALDLQVESVGSHRGGLTILQYGTLLDASLEASVEQRDAAIERAMAPLDGLRPRVLSVLGVTPEMTSAEAPDNAVRGQLMYRTNAAEHVDIVAGGAAADAVLIGRSHARALDLRPGEEFTLDNGGRRVSVEVGGVYRDLPTQPGTDYWIPLARNIYPDAGDDNIPPLFVIAEPDLFYELDAALGDERPLARWEYPIQSGISLDVAERLASGIIGVEDQLDRASGGGLEAFDFSNHATLLPDLVTNARQTVEGIGTPTRLLSAAGAGIALAMLGAAGVYAVRRRRVEAALLSARGLGPVALGFKASIESLLPIALGLVAGWWLAAPLIARLGPSTTVSPAARAAALQVAILAGCIAVVVIGTVSGFSARAEAETTFTRLPGALRRFPWEWLTVALAVAAYFQLRSDGFVPAPGDPLEPVKVDILLLAFPLLAIIGGAGLASKLLGRLLPGLRAIGPGAPAAVYLAVRRLASTPGLALTLITASAAAIGILAYAGTLVSSVNATADAKANVSTGSDVSARLGLEASVPDDLPFPATVVEYVDLMTVQPGDRQATVLAVDPEDFGSAAYWNPDFSGESLDELLARLEDRGGPLPAIVTGGTLGSGDSDLSLFTTRIPLEVVAETDAWPGMNTFQPTIIVSTGAFHDAIESTDGSLAGANQQKYLWARGDAEVVTSTLAESGLSLSLVFTAEDARDTPGLLATSWTFSYLEALGLVAGVVVLAGLLLYLQARQRAGVVAFALARRMGLKASTHRLSVGLEVLVMLMMAAMIGLTIALVSVSLIYRGMDLLPQLPPAPLLSVPLERFGIVAAVLVAATLTAAWRVHRTATRAKIAEVLRLAG